MLLRLSQRWRPAAAKRQAVPRVSARIYHAASLDNTNRLEDGGAATLSPAFMENKRSMEGIICHLRQLIDQAVAGGGQKAIDRHKSRGKMLPRDRILALLDPGSPFLELSQLAGHQLYGKNLNQVLKRSRVLKL